MPAIRREILETIRNGASVFRSPERGHRLIHRLARFQQHANSVYRRWCALRACGTSSRRRRPFNSPPCLPIAAWKESDVASFHFPRRHPWFESSGTGGGPDGIVSRHHLRSLDLYKASVIEGWKWFHRMRRTEDPSTEKRTFVALMPSFRENPHSSLSCMLEILMKTFGDGRGLWCFQAGRWNWPALCARLQRLEKENRPPVLLGTAFAWVHFLDACAASRLRFQLPRDSLVLETGGYKGRSREVARPSLHRGLARLFGIGIEQVCSEYSMCEISSQAYSLPRQSGAKAAPHVFQFPPWCRSRVVHPGTFSPVSRGERGVLEIHDLANVDSCAFVRTEDMALARGDGFELAGRLPKSGLKGCSLAFEIQKH